MSSPAKHNSIHIPKKKFVLKKTNLLSKNLNITLLPMDSPLKHNNHSKHKVNLQKNNIVKEGEDDSKRISQIFNNSILVSKITDTIKNKMKGLPIKKTNIFTPKKLNKSN